MVITSFSLKFLRSSSVVATGLLRVNTPPTVALTRTAVGSFCQFVPKSSSLLQEASAAIISAMPIYLIVFIVVVITVVILSLHWKSNLSSMARLPFLLPLLSPCQLSKPMCSRCSPRELRLCRMSIYKVLHST